MKMRRYYKESTAEIEQAVDAKMGDGAYDILKDVLSTIPQSKLDELEEEIMDVAEENPEALPDEVQDELLASEGRGIPSAVGIGLASLICILGLGFQGTKLVKCNEIKDKIQQIQNCKSEKEEEGLRRELAKYIMSNSFWVGDHYRTSKDGKSIQHTVNSDSMLRSKDDRSVPSWHDIKDGCGSHGFFHSPFEESRKAKRRRA